MYKSKLSLIETERAIKKLKDYFQEGLERELTLERISAPLFVEVSTGLNDDLNGIEQPVGFEKFGKSVQIVHSLAKWKRMALKRYDFKVGQGLYTDMNAIRKDEDLSPIHSLYVDQWDWELVMKKNQRTTEYLHDVVNKIYNVFLSTSKYIKRDYPVLTNWLPDEIFFITSEELLQLFPNNTPKEREYEISKRHKAVFISQIGKRLSDNSIHDGRAPDYDDWELNGDIIFYNDVLDIAFEVSSMGIRVDAKTLDVQLTERNADHKRDFEFHKQLLKGNLPYTVGGGIGQSRLCMYFLDKLHVGEVQASYWSDEIIAECDELGIILL